MRVCASVFLALFVFLFVFPCVPSQAELPVVKTSDHLESPFAKVYEKVAPAVVLIEIESSMKSQNQQYDPWQYFFNVPTPKQQEQQPMRGMGSGVIISREGYIITNNHVIANDDEKVADKITVTLSDDRKFQAEVIGRDPETDIAVIKLKLDGKLLPPEEVAEFGDSDTIKPGDYAIAIGNPLGLERTITVGVISAVGRFGLNPQGARKLQFQNFIQTDAQINPGNSGGALADINGKVIGINNMYTFQYAGVGFAVPINLVKEVSDQIINAGEVKRGFVGIQVPPGESGDVTKEIQEALGLPSTNGAFVQQVIPGSPAEKAGLERGDVILTLNGETVKDFRDFMFKVAKLKPGAQVSLGVFHDGKQKTISLTLGDRKDYLELAETSNLTNWRGISVLDVTNPQAQKYNIGEATKGVIVVDIDKNSPAGQTKLFEGDVILEINQKAVNNVQDFLKIKDEFKESEKPILVFRQRTLQSGQTIKGYVAIPAK